MCLSRLPCHPGCQVSSKHIGEERSVLRAAHRERAPRSVERRGRGRGGLLIVDALELRGPKGDERVAQPKRNRELFSLC
jgi:hypothetical protein